ncbi:MAG: EAL domain-containing protein [Shewanella sp.]
MRSVNTYMYDISAIALLLLPLTLTNAIIVLIGQGLLRVGYGDAAHQLFSCSTLLINLYPLSMCVITSYYLSRRTSFNSGSFIIFTLSFLYILSYGNQFFSPPYYLPNNTMLAILSPFITLLYCAYTPQRILSPSSPDFTLVLLSHVTHFFCFAAIAFGLSVLSPYLLEQLTALSGGYQLDPLTFTGGLIYQAILGGLGAIGINGHNFLLPVKQMLHEMSVNNLADWQAGLAPLNTISQGFYEAFLSMGGSGNSISLLLCILIFSKHRHHTILALAALPLILFNINEVLLFGLPIIFNPILIIPFVIVPIISFVVAYVAISTGLFTPVMSIVDWMTPPLISGYIATNNNLDGTLLQLIIIVLGIVIYYPFYIAFAGKGINKNQRIDNTEHLSLQQMLREMKTISQHNKMCSHAQHQVETMFQKGNFVMFYQRLKQIQSGRRDGFEALVRYCDEHGKLHSPTFINYFQQLCLMPMLDKIIIDLVLADMQRMPLAQLSRVSLNISAESISQPDFVGHLLQRIQHYGIAFDKIEIEITEEALLDDTEQLLKTIVQLQQMGIDVAMDDFGSGFASFPHLMRYPFNKVKLDRSLLLDCSNEKGKKLYRLLSNIGSIAECSVVSEGVETEAERIFVTECGVDIIQGYLIAKPEPLTEILRHLSKSTGNYSPRLVDRGVVNGIVAPTQNGI